MLNAAVRNFQGSLSVSYPYTTHMKRSEMSRYTISMLGGLAMTALSGVLMIWWLALGDVSSGIIGLLFILGMFIGMAVFAGSAAEALRSPGGDSR